MPHTEQQRLTSCGWTDGQCKSYGGTHLFLLDMTIQLKIDKLTARCVMVTVEAVKMTVSANRLMTSSHR
jgi:hypothetical protein